VLRNATATSAAAPTHSAGRRVSSKAAASSPPSATCTPQNTHQYGRVSTSATSGVLALCRVWPAARRAVAEAAMVLRVTAEGTHAVVVGATSTPAPTLDDALRSFGNALAAASPVMTAAMPASPG
jgi:hypothetical protein